MSLYEQFLSLSTVPGDDGGITRQTFEICLGPLRNYANIIIGRLFSFFDQDNDGIISFEEMVRGLSVISKGTLEERIQCICY
jgi:Ca2+-binding EF-hand superfamily protein